VFDLRFSGIFAVIAFILSLLIGLVSRATMPMLIIRPSIFAVIFFVFAAFAKILVGRFLPELLEERADEDIFSPGSRVNILEGDSPADSSAMTEGFISGALGPSPVSATGAKPDESDDGLGDISELSRRISFSQGAGGSGTPIESISGVDQNVKELYTDDGGSGDSAAPDFSNMFTPDPAFDAPSGGQAKSAGKGAGTRPGTVASVAPKAGGSFDSDEVLPDLDSMAEAFMSGSSDEEQGAAEYSAPGPSRKPASSSNKAPDWTKEFNAKDIAMGLRTVLNKEKEG